ncbi:MAG: K(+)-insensitive pyrophosphate-energized proton pump [Candidatus Kaiserbacteria bacterium GW2011_GWB1_52_6]|uniref:K(+)-insensitive pyrophosphate-energized proton pump n=1 Tax=Candidatus Kaiserbacteria bacterium GW2011_GWB1_52_6 TaxID=1618674 RepID=A0A0G1X5B7_9BACT|nr:MAG: K(+)-insensitive pyrophosphate-energized proton pump [Candidatus Kaiserbacteria bacterium GW2011_GWB1_52_6]
MDTYLLYAVGAGVLALAYGLFLVINILKQPDGEGKMVEIAEAIQAGAKAYLNRQYRTVGIVALIIIGVMWLANFSGTTIAGSCSVLSCPPWRDSSV